MTHLTPLFSISAAAIVCLAGCAAKQQASDGESLTVNPFFGGSLGPTPGTPAFHVRAKTPAVLGAVQTNLSKSGRYEVLRGEGDWLLVRDLKADLPISQTMPDPQHVRAYHVAVLMTFHTDPNGDFAGVGFKSLGEISPLATRFPDWFSPSNPFTQWQEAATSAIDQAMIDLDASQPVTSR